jgi:uncharacterized protein (PEP-CTERM system associated)
VIPRPRIPARAFGCLALLSACGTLDTARADITFIPRIGAGVTWSDNFNLASHDEPKQDDTVIDATPGFAFAHRSQRMRSTVDYELRYFDFLSSDNGAQTFHELDARSDIDVVQEWLALSLAASYGQTLRSPTGQGVYANGIFSFGNLTDQGTARISPKLNHDFSWGNLSAEYIQGWVEYDDDLLPDSQDRIATAAVTFGDEESRLLTRFGYSTDTIAYESGTARYEFERAFAELGWRVGRNLRLIAQGGAESDLAATVREGGLEESFWNGGFEWQPDRSNHLRVLAGERFFGNTITAEWTRDSRLLDLRVGYDEGPTTESRELSLVAQTVPTDPLPPALPEAGQSPDFSRPGSDVYIRKIFSASVVMEGRLTRLELRGSHEIREYIELFNEDKIDDFALTGERRLGSVWRLRGSVGASDLTLREGTDYREYRIEIGGIRSIGRSLSLDMSIAHVDRSGALEDYQAKWATLRLLKEFGGSTQ